MRGGEKVLEAIAGIYPKADIFTLVHVKGSVSPLIESRTIRTSFIQRLPASGRLYRHYLPLFPMAVEQFDLDEYDLVISSSHCAAKAVLPPGQRAPRLLLPFADALRLGPVRRVLRRPAHRRASARRSTVR